MSKSNDKNRSADNQSGWEDSRVTSYVLDELSEDDRQQFESELNSSEPMQAAVEQARSIASQLEGLFAAEKTPSLEDARRESIVTQAKSGGNAVAVNRSELKYGAPSWGTPLMLMATAAVLLLLVGIAPFLRQRATLTALDPANQVPANQVPGNQVTGNLPTRPDVLADSAMKTESVMAEESVAARQSDQVGFAGKGLSKKQPGAVSDLIELKLEDEEESLDLNLRPQASVSLDEMRERLRERQRRSTAASGSEKQKANAQDLPSSVPPNDNEDAGGPGNPMEKSLEKSLGLPSLDALSMKRTESAADVPMEAQVDSRGRDAIAQAQDRIMEELGPVGSASADIGISGDAEIALIPDLSQIVVKGPKKDVSRVKKIIEQLDAQVDDKPANQMPAIPAPVAPAPTAAAPAKQFSRAAPSSAPADSAPAEPTAPSRRKAGLDDVHPMERSKKQKKSEASSKDIQSEALGERVRNARSRSNDKSSGEKAGGDVEGRGVRPKSSDAKVAMNIEKKVRDSQDKLVPGQKVDEGRGPESAGDQFAPIDDNDFKRVAEEPVSTFSADVDTASYSKVRDYIMRTGSLPRLDAVRIEEMLNYFDYGYQPPGSDAEHPFVAHMEVTGCPWTPEHRLARIAIKGQVLSQAERPACNLVFLLDTSGSMDQPNKLPLVLEGMKMLADQLTQKDKVAIAVYSGSAGTVLDSTPANKKKKIQRALAELSAGGSTAGGEGIALAYQLARDNFISDGVNRVILCTDGDFNVGVTGTDALVRMVEQESRGGIFLSVLGFGMGNHNDAMLEQISGRGNGNYAFIDTQAEAKKVLVDQTSGTLVTIAKDVKLQLEFNPKRVAQYRLIGYENRLLAKEDFNDDKKDASEIGAGHTVTALYEIVPAGVEPILARPKVDELKYQQTGSLSDAADTNELLTLKIRYKLPDEDTSTKVDFVIQDDDGEFASADSDFRFAAAVAGLGMKLRHSKYAGTWTISDVLRVAQEATGDDKYQLRAEFVEIVKKASKLMGEE